MTGRRWLPLLLLALVLPLGSAGAQDAAYLATLQARADEARLWEARFWHLLGHYRPNLLGGYTSEADGTGFFVAPDGRSNPRAELHATLAALFSSDPRPPAGMTPQCTFPARTRWLREQLDIDPERLPPQDCPRFQAWRDALQPESVSLIFADFYLNNPASTFGHTLLRFNKRGRSENTRLLDYAVNYAAAVPDDANAISYMIFGVFGGYEGYFSLLPYYVKVREYNDVESRDLWEYELNLPPERVEWMMMHAWELGSTYFDYYFFRENCSYHLLSLIEIGDPSLNLRDEYALWTLPTDTVRQVAAQPGLVRELRYRPSRSSLLAWRMGQLTDAERAGVETLVAQPEAVEEAWFAGLPPQRQALMLDAAADYYQYEIADKGEDEAEEQNALRRELRGLLVHRSRLRVDVPGPEEPDAPPPPHEGHRSSRVALGGGGANDDTGFASLIAQPGYHDLLSDDTGFAPRTQINALLLEGRYEAEPEAWRLERLDVLDITSLLPASGLLTQPSWHLRVGWRRNRDLGCAYCVPFNLAGGVGLAGETAVLGRQTWYALAEARAEYDDAFTQDHRAGLGASLGVLADWGRAWRLHLRGTRIGYGLGHTGPVNEGLAGLRYAATRNLELRLEWRAAGRYSEGTLTAGYYF